jgi:DoxX-like family
MGKMIETMTAYLIVVVAAIVNLWAAAGIAVPIVGLIAAGGLIVFFLGAIATHLRARDYSLGYGVPILFRGPA